MHGQRNIKTLDDVDDSIMHIKVGVNRVFLMKI